MGQINGNNRNLQVLRGLSTNRSLLSCQPDGKTVDLWWQDDGSGRQQWNISPVPGYDNIYNIIVSGGNSTDNKYLGAVAPGDWGNVDLTSGDDGTGRQRWQFIPVKSNIPDCYNIMVVGGETDNFVYLSCFEDGSVVNLAEKDDGSGLQRWQLQ